MSSVVKVKVEGRLHTVDCAAAETHCQTYAQLKQVLERQGHLSPDHVLVDPDDNDLDPSAPIDLSGQGGVVYVKWLSFDIVVVDEHASQVLQVSQHRTIRQVREAFEAETSRPVPVLSYNGHRLEDNATLVDYRIAEGSTLIGRVKVTIHDIKCDLSTFVTLFDFSTVAELKSRYSETSRRTLVDGATLSFRGDVLNDETTLFQAEIRDRSTVEFENPPYEITVADEEDEVQGETNLLVADHFSAAMVKEAYAKETRQALVPEDRLAYEELLDDTELIYTAGVGPGARLTLHREDQSRATEYECGGCGGIVKLKRTEPTRCRSCGYRIVYKLRTTRPCQYIAR